VYFSDNHVKFIDAFTEPQMIRGPSNTTAFVDSNLTMTCEASGSRSYEWYRRSSTVNNRWMQLEKSDRYRIFKRNGTLLFTRILGSDTGFYRCTAYASAMKARVDSPAAYLEVQGEYISRNLSTSCFSLWTIDCRDSYWVERVQR